VLAVGELEAKLLSARLFAVLAILQFGLAMFENKTAHQSIDVYFHATYFVVAKTHLQIIQALASACFALIYLAASRWVLHPLNNFLGLTHLVVATIGSVLLSVSLSAFVSLPSASGLPAIPPANHWPLLACFAGVLCFLSGCAMLAVNCTWTAITVFRSL
jgi:heme/copper-type cytochrome/quinol oxidase subunit 1